MTPEVLPVRCAVMRGGTSKAVFLHPNQVPLDAEERQRFLLALFGSPDRRQIDGLGGADPLTSKCAIVGPSQRDDADVDYTFVQVGVEAPEISLDIVCGNISSAVAVFAVEEGWAAASRNGSTPVRIFNTNTGSLIHARVGMRGDRPAVEGECSVDGVPGTGAPVWMDYADTAGAITGNVLPTGRALDLLPVPELGRDVEVSIVDAGTPSVFFGPEALGLTGTEMPADLSREHYKAAEAIRRAAQQRCGIAQADMVPFQIMVGSPAVYATFSGEARLTATDMDLCARAIWGAANTLHKAFPGGGAVATAVAARIEGTLPHRAAASQHSALPVRIGHPSGVMTVESEVTTTHSGPRVLRVEFPRTARRLMDGTTYVRLSRLAGGPHAG